MGPAPTPAPEGEGQRRERWDGGYGEWFVVVNRFKTKVSTMNVSLQLDTAGGTGVISSLVARMAVA